MAATTSVASVYSLENIKATMAKKGYAFFDSNKKFNVNLIGVRTSKTYSNTFDDKLFLIYRDDNLAEQFFIYDFTTDPGIYWLQHPMNSDGCAILVPNQYRGAWAIGLHKGEYEALVQIKPVKVFRDKDLDGTLDMDYNTITEGITGINIHRSNPYSESYYVDKWSAGCNVFAKVKDFNFTMDICRKSRDLYGNTFTYTLLNDTDFA